MRITVFANAASWGGGKGARSPACSFLLEPSRPVSACSGRSCWKERVFPWQGFSSIYSPPTPLPKKNVHNVLFPQMLEMSTRPFPRSAAQACLVLSAGTRQPWLLPCWGSCSCPVPRPPAHTLSQGAAEAKPFRFQ